MKFKWYQWPYSIFVLNVVAFLCFVAIMLVGVLTAPAPAQGDEEKCFTRGILKGTETIWVSECEKNATPPVKILKSPPRYLADPAPVIPTPTKAEKETTVQQSPREKKKLFSQPKQHHKLEGKASWYGWKFHGGKTASGEKFNMYKVSAAHKTLPLGTKVRIVPKSKAYKPITAIINDRGPYIQGRIVDLSYEAARRVGMLRDGVIDVYLEIIH